MPVERMDSATEADWVEVAGALAQEQNEVPLRIELMLRSLESQTSGYAVDQLQHALQTATRARRSGADDELVVSALCHDIGKVLSVPNHPAIGAELLRPYVREDCYWIVRTHQDFQGRHYYELVGRNPNSRDQYRSEDWFGLAETFTDEWDQCSFDPDFESDPLDDFRGELTRVFSEPRYFPRVLVSWGQEQQR